MASSPDYQRNYQHEYDIESRKRRDQRAARNRAHRVYMRAYGGVPEGDDVDHKTPLSKGGAETDLRNLRLRSASANRSFPRNPDGSMSDDQA